MEIQIPFNKTFIPLKNIEKLHVDVLRIRGFPAVSAEDEDRMVLEAMNKPLGSPSLHELAVGKKTAVILCSDHTRPVPSRIIIPHMLRELREGNPDIEVTLLIATGCHRATNADELREKLGADIYGRERIAIHDCKDSSAMTDIGALPSGGRLVVNRAAVEADLLLAEGFIEPHFFAGYSGGRKSVLPGICDRITVFGNHCSEFINSPYARTGFLDGNPIHRDMQAAAEMAGLRYIVNVVVNEEKQVVAAFAGNPETAHRHGCDYLRGHAGVRCEIPGDIVVTSNGGYPLDQNVYQAVKSLSTAADAAAPGAVLIVCSGCADGVGDDDFFSALKQCKDMQSLLEEALSVPMDKTKPSQWQYQVLARILCRHRAIFVTSPSASHALGEMKLEYAPTLDEAMRRAIGAKGENARVTVIPNGISTIIER